MLNIFGATTSFPFCVETFIRIHVHNILSSIIDETFVEKKVTNNNVTVTLNSAVVVHLFCDIMKYLYRNKTLVICNFT